MYRQYRKRFGEGVSFMPVYPSDFDHQQRTLNLKNAEEVKLFKYRQVEVGISVPRAFLSKKGKICATL